MGRKSKYDPKYCDELIEHMSEGYSLEGFAGKLMVSKMTIYAWVDAHPEFAEAKQVGESAARYWFEKVANLAMKGRIENFNATVYIFNMKNRFGWRDKQEVTGENGGPLTMELIVREYE
jgi:hypothetical protein